MVTSAPNNYINRYFPFTGQPCFVIVPICNKISRSLHLHFVPLYLFSEEEEEEKTEPSNQESLLHTWYGYTKVIPRSFSTLAGHQVQRVSLGAHHGAVITRAQQLLTFGSNKHGQLGDPAFLESCEQPNIVPNLQGQYLENLFLAFCQYNY